MTGDIDISPGYAAAALASVDQSVAAVREHSRWVGGALAAYGMATLLFFPASGLMPGVWWDLAWGVFLVGLLCYVRPRLVLGRGFRRLFLSSTAVWTVLWVGLAVLGQVAFAGVAGYWLPAGVVVATPMLVAAVRARA